MKTSLFAAIALSVSLSANAGNVERTPVFSEQCAKFFTYSAYYDNQTGRGNPKSTSALIGLANLHSFMKAMGYINIPAITNDPYFVAEMRDETKRRSMYESCEKHILTFEMMKIADRQLSR